MIITHLKHVEYSIIECFLIPIPPHQIQNFFQIVQWNNCCNWCCLIRTTDKYNIRKTCFYLQNFYKVCSCWLYMFYHLKGIWQILLHAYNPFAIFIRRKKLYREVMLFAKRICALFAYMCVLTLMWLCALRRDAFLYVTV